MDTIQTSDYVAQLRAEQAALEAFVAALPAEQLTLPGVCGKWSVKDVLVHITVWSRYVTERTRAGLAGRDITPHALWGPHLPSPELQDDALNEWMVEQTATWSVGEVLGMQREVMTQLIGLAQSVSDGVLSDPELEIKGLPWKKGKPLWQVLNHMSVEHIHEHLATIRTALRA
jgi:Protein of unknown function (DUF1706)